MLIKTLICPISSTKWSYSESALGENKAALKVKNVNLFLSTPQAHTSGCTKFSPHPWFTSAPNKDKSLTSRPGLFIPSTEHRYQLNVRLGGEQHLSEHF